MGLGVSLYPLLNLNQADLEPSGNSWIDDGSISYVSPDEYVDDTKVILLRFCELADSDKASIDANSRLLSVRM